MSDNIIPHNILVFEEHAGPIPSEYDFDPNASPSKGLRYEYVAYADAENDAGLYGYGHTVGAAIADYCRNHAEAFCNGCYDCQGDRDCLLTSGQLATITANRVEAYVRDFLDYTEDSTSHEDWRDLNNGTNETNEIEF